MSFLVAKIECHHELKSIAENNGWTKKEAKILIRNSGISQIIQWLDLSSLHIGAILHLLYMDQILSAYTKAKDVIFFFRCLHFFSALDSFIH